MSLDQEINAIVDMRIQQLIEIITRVSPNLGEDILDEYRKLSYYQAKKSVQIEISAFDTIVDPKMEMDSGFSMGRGILTPSDVHFDYGTDVEDTKFNFKNGGYVPDDAERQQILKDKPYLFVFDETSEPEIEAKIAELEAQMTDLDHQDEEDQLSKKYDLVMSETIK